MSEISLIVQAFATFFMTGVIWMVQVLVYPAFARVDAAQFRDFHAHHTPAITPIVGPVMLLELIASGWFALFPPPGLNVFLVRGAFVLTLFLWGATAFVSVPFHDRLGGGFNPDAHNALVNTNWIRTIIWSARSILVIYFLWKTFGGGSLSATA